MPFQIELRGNVRKITKRTSQKGYAFYTFEAENIYSVKGEQRLEVFEISAFGGAIDEVHKLVDGAFHTLFCTLSSREYKGKYYPSLTLQEVGEARQELDLAQTEKNGSDAVTATLTQQQADDGLPF